ncbi:unnamed protein product, partial [Discosporangium mesarthrocarpum]
MPLDDRSCFILVEYSEEKPPLLANKGMASKILNFLRPAKKGTLESEVGK